MNWSVFFYSILLILFVGFQGKSISAQELFTINTADSPPYSTPLNTGIYDQIILKVFDSLGLTIKINHLSSARSIENVDIGLDDAEYARIKGLNEKFTNILPVNEKLMDFSFTAFSKDPGIRITGWEGLKKYNVGFIRGWKIYEINVKNTRSLHVVSSEVELFNMLLKDRVDIILYEKLRGYDFLSENHISGVFALENPLSVRGMYLYVHKKHENLIPKIENALQEIKRSGEYNDIVEAFIQ
ncbi:substrate-binding periplasmic protein [Desulfomarina sp.]